MITIITALTAIGAKIIFMICLIYLVYRIDVLGGKNKADWIMCMCMWVMVVAAVASKITRIINVGLRSPFVDAAHSFDKFPVIGGIFTLFT